MLANIDSPISFAAITAIFGLFIGIAYGFLAERSKFCLRRALAGVDIDRESAAAVWISGFFMAMLGTQVLIAAGLIDLSEHRLLNPEIPFLGAILGGAIFGIGMILTRGCISRLTVLTGTGNLRALTVIIVFGIIANATLKGILSSPRVWLSSTKWSFDLQGQAWYSPWIFVALFGAIAGVIIWRFGHHKMRNVMGACIGLLVPLSWYIVSVVLFDEFDPKPIEGLSFTLPHADANFWIEASTAVTLNFGIGFVAGVVSGALLSSLLGKTFEWQSFGSPRQTGRYLLGALCLGFGGVVAGGCSVGVGLSGMSMLSVTAFLALGSMMIAGFITGRYFP